MDDLVIKHTVTGALKLVLIIGAAIWLIPRHTPEKESSGTQGNSDRAEDGKGSPVRLLAEVGVSNDRRD